MFLLKKKKVVTFKVPNKKKNGKFCDKKEIYLIVKFKIKRNPTVGFI